MEQNITDMGEVSDQEKRNAIVFVLQKLRRMTLENPSFTKQQYQFEYYDTPSDDSYLAQNEPSILNYLEQAGVVAQTVIDNDTEFVVWVDSINALAEKEVLQKLGLKDSAYKIIDDRPLMAPDDLPRFNKQDGTLSIGDLEMRLRPNSYQYLICKHCMDNFGNYVTELAILDDYSHDAGMQARTIRDASKALNLKANKVFGLANLFIYSSGSVRINAELFAESK